MGTYTVSIVGKPNAGKSTLFNRIIGKRQSVVADTPGVTRDKLSGSALWNGKNFLIFDTGGLTFGRKDLILREIEAQVNAAINESDLIIFLCDAKTGVEPLDTEIARYLIKSGKKVIFTVNKTDVLKSKEAVYDFYELGLGNFIEISAEHGLGINDLLDEITANIKDESYKTPPGLKIAVVGKPNVGKSSIVNKLSGKKVSIVTDIPGTTRDSVDSVIKWEGKRVVLIDTAGLRKKSRVKEEIEYYSNLRAVKSVNECDLAVLVIDASSDIGDQDLKIASVIRDFVKPVLIAVNKWDLVKNKEADYGKIIKKLSEKFHFLDYAVKLTVSCVSAVRINDILKNAFEIYDSAFKAPTRPLNDFLNETILLTPPLPYKGKEVKIKYIAMVRDKPPIFHLFVNNPVYLAESYRRFIMNRLREKYKFSGWPLILKVRKK